MITFLMLSLSTTIGASFSHWNIATYIKAFPSLLEFRVTCDHCFEFGSDTSIDICIQCGRVGSGKNIKSLVQCALMNGRAAFQFPMLAQLPVGQFGHEG